MPQFGGPEKKNVKIKNALVSMTYTVIYLKFTVNHIMTLAKQECSHLKEHSYSNNSLQSTVDAPKRYYLMETVYFEHLANNSVALETLRAYLVKFASHNFDSFR